MASAVSNVYQFKITLRDIKPNIWRRIQVPESYNFYELHVAIADAMGWADYHLHQFIMKKPSTGTKVYITTPSDDDYGFGFGPQVEKIDEESVKIAQYFVAEKVKALYEYDFGDCWEHDVVLEKILPAAENVEYPRCLAGKRACPPEDCGSTYGYEELLQIIANPEHEEYKEKMEWLEQFGNENFDPEEFDPNSVYFDDPKERKQFREMFS